MIPEIVLQPRIVECSDIEHSSFFFYQANMLWWYTVESPGVARHMDLRMSYFSVSELMHESLQSFASNISSINIIIEAKDAKYHRLSIHEQNRR